MTEWRCRTTIRMVLVALPVGNPAFAVGPIAFAGAGRNLASSCASCLRGEKLRTQPRTPCLSGIAPLDRTTTNRDSAILHHEDSKGTKKALADQRHRWIWSPGDRNRLLPTDEAIAAIGTAPSARPPPPCSRRGSAPTLCTTDTGGGMTDGYGGIAAEG